MPAKTSAFTVTTAATAVATTVATKTVTVFENTVGGTVAFSVLAPLSNSTAINKATGASFTFTCPGAYWPALTTVGYLKAASGSVSFAQFEDGL